MRREWLEKRLRDEETVEEIRADVYNNGRWIDRLPEAKIPTWARGKGRYNKFKKDIRELMAEEGRRPLPPAGPAQPTNNANPTDPTKRPEDDREAKTTSRVTGRG